MASATYKNILREVEQLTDKERQVLVTALMTPAEPPSMGGTDFFAILDALPSIDAQTLDEIKRIVDEDCERIDPDDWS